MSTLVLKDSQQCRVAIQPKSKAGNPATVDGVPAWESLDPATVSVEVEADGMAALVKAVGPVGATSVRVTADADMGDGVVPVTGSFNVSVEGGQAADFGVTFGDITEQPAAPPA